jgi:hypothetical protein
MTADLLRGSGKKMVVPQFAQQTSNACGVAVASMAALISVCD